MRCPICARAIDPAGSAEQECTRCRAALRVEGANVTLRSLGRVPPGLELDVAKAGAASYRAASDVPDFAAHRRWRKLDMVIPFGLCVPFVGFVLWTRSLSGSGAVLATMRMIMGVAVTTLTFFAVWYLIAYALNRSTLHVSSDALRCTTGPIPWPWRRGVAVTPSRGLRVEAVAVERKVKELSPQMRKAMERTGEPVMTTRWWNLVAFTPGGEVALFRQLGREEAHYLAERVRRTLGQA